MAKISGINTKLSGQIGEYLFRQTKYGTIVSEAPVRRDTPQRTESQMYIRTQWVNLAAVYRQFNKTLKKAFERLGNSMSVYNAFVQANINVVKVFITKKIKLNGGSALAPYMITRGTLPSIAYEKNGSNVLVTDIRLGDLVINAETMIGELAETVIALNDDFKQGDQITFFYGVQTIDSVTGTPRAKISGAKVVLDVSDSTPLWDVTGDMGFTSVGGFLGMAQAITNGAAAWVHSRDLDGAELRVGTQNLYVDSTVLASYQGASAMANSAQSYGGINSERVFLQPTVGVLSVGSAMNGEDYTNINSGGSASGNGNVNDNPNDNTGGTGGNPSTGSGTGTGGNTGGNTGGGDNGGGNSGGSGNEGYTD